MPRHLLIIFIALFRARFKLLVILVIIIVLFLIAIELQTIIVLEFLQRLDLGCEAKCLEALLQSLGKRSVLKVSR